MTVEACQIYRNGFAYYKLVRIKVASGDATQTTGISLGEEWADQIILEIIVSDPSSTGLDAGTIDIVKASDNSLIKAAAYTIASGSYKAGSLEDPRDIAKAASHKLLLAENIKLVLKSTAASAADGTVKVLIKSIIANDIKERDYS